MIKGTFGSRESGLRPKNTKNETDFESVAGERENDPNHTEKNLRRECAGELGESMQVQKSYRRQISGDAYSPRKVKGNVSKQSGKPWRSVFNRLSRVRAKR